jgi:hypothetical protein
VVQLERAQTRSQRRAGKPGVGGQSVGPSLEDGVFHTCAEWSETATDQTLGRTITGGESCMDVDHRNPELRDKLL